ncbi:hypothetical protein ACFV6D_10465 [Kitasatospora sp. NPDC059812]|uniref:hypothetical protein n=1 Tax=Kitasatospora sp. NPDC059812 TaxID=3346958 RepID=UPI0036565CB8
MKMKRMAAVAASTAVLSAGMVFASSAAEAATECQSVYANGSLCISSNNDGYNAVYTKWSGDPAYVDFALICGTQNFYDQGAFWISAGEMKTYFFAVGRRSDGCRVKLTDVNNGGTWQTPRI